MIIDKISNLNLYDEIPKEVKDFILNCTKNIDQGRVYLSENIYANVDIYTTKKLSEIKFEAHQKYIDIQLLLYGKENIYVTDKSVLTVKSEYNEESDCAFYQENPSEYSKLILDASNFVMLYPHEAHAPQASVNNIPTEVKKIVVKIKI